MSVILACSPINQDLGMNGIHLLRLHPSNEFNAPILVTLETVDFSEEPVYKALSYVWGDPDVTSAILVNGAIFEATTNLISALLNLRKDHHAEVFWIDAICMNQRNVQERNHQVQMMAKIYKGAEEVIAWLGESADDSDEALKLLPR
ncbi:hypothetical protein E8E11_010002 [Didymella keratinophila]|nr:hypothetical protein E8E11_010002 [Didymella keratinophila]